MLMRLMHSYSLKLVFAVTLLLGIQMPGFLQQYEHRVDAHYQEAKRQLNQYQSLADLYFSGDLQVLIRQHKKSEILLFRAEAQIIETLLNRLNYLQAKKNALQGPLISRLYFLVTQINRPLLLETRKNYSAQITLSQNAITFGVLAALLCTLFMDLFFSILRYLCRLVLIRRQMRCAVKR